MSVTPQYSFQLHDFDGRSGIQVRDTRYEVLKNPDPSTSPFVPYLCFTSSLSTVSNSNLISFHVSMAIFSSGLDLAALVRMSLPSFSKARPWLRASTQASRATRLAAAPAALPHGWPRVPPPNCNTESSPKILTSAGMCHTWMPPEATANTPGMEPQSWSKKMPMERS